MRKVRTALGVLMAVVLTSCGGTSTPASGTGEGPLTIGLALLKRTPRAAEAEAANEDDVAV